MPRQDVKHQPLGCPIRWDEAVTYNQPQVAVLREQKPKNFK